MARLSCQRKLERKPIWFFGSASRTEFCFAEIVFFSRQVHPYDSCRIALYPTGFFLLSRKGKPHFIPSWSWILLVFMMTLLTVGLFSQLPFRCPDEGICKNRALPFCFWFFFKFILFDSRNWDSVFWTTWSCCTCGAPIVHFGVKRHYHALVWLNEKTGVSGIDLVRCSDTRLQISGTKNPLEEARN